MSIRRMSKKGFTLVEILIVVIILGILAAIVIPQFTNASQDARKSSLVSQLQTLRSQIELYKLQHKDKLPKLLTNWDQMTSKTDDDGVVAAAGEFGPYMQSAPTNPLNGSSVVLAGDGTAKAASACGFVYDFGTIDGTTGDGDGTGKIWGTDTDGVTIYQEN